jgi:hypothetical protein
MRVEKMKHVNENVKLILEGCAEYFRAFSLAKGIECNSFDLIEYVYPQQNVVGPDFIFNTEINNHINLKLQIEDIINGMKNSVIPNKWIVPEIAETKRLMEILNEFGFDDLTNAREPEYGMAATLDDLPQFNVDSNIIIRKVNDLEEFREWIDVVNKALHEFDFLNLPQYESWLANPQFRFYLGYAGDYPVSTGAYFLNNNHASLEFISTLKDNRCKGFAGNIIYQMMLDLRKNSVLNVTLRSSHMATELYKSLGFQPYYVQHIFSWKG